MRDLGHTLLANDCNGDRVVPLNTPFDPWPWRRRVLATAAAAAALTVVIAALVTAPPDSPQGMAGPPVGTSADESVLPGTEGEGAEQPGNGADPESTDPTKDDPTGTGNGGEQGDGGDPKPPGGGGDDDDDDDPPAPPPAHVTSVKVNSVKQTSCTPCVISATVTVDAYDKREVAISVTIAGSDGSGSRTYTYSLSGSKSYTVTVPGSQGSYKSSWVDCDNGESIVATASGDGKSGSNSLACPR